MDKYYSSVTVYELADFGEFAEGFELGEKDLILTHGFLHKAYIEPLGLKCQYLFYEDYASGEPTEDAVNEILKKVSAMKISRVIGVGGGSILDTAKLLCIKGAENVLDIYEDRIPLVRDKGLVLVPTTCGTGSEMDGVAVVHINKHNCKIGKGGPGSFPDAAVLIPQLLENLPYEIFMYCSLDALIHGIESYLSPLSHSFSNVFNAEAVRLIVRNYKRMRDNGVDERKLHLPELARASSYAGIGLSHNPCGAIHACAMVFGGVHHTPHGQTNAIFMNSILKRYAEKQPDGSIKELAKIICEELGIIAGAAGAFEELHKLITGLITLDPLSKFGMKASDSLEYAEKVLATQNRLIINSYADLTAEELADVFRELC